MAVNGLNGCKWQYMAVHGCKWQYMAVHGCKWPEKDWLETSGMAVNGCE